MILSVLCASGHPSCQHWRTAWQAVLCFVLSFRRANPALRVVADLAVAAVGCTCNTQVYRLDVAAGALIEEEVLSTAAKAGPRHMCYLAEWILSCLIPPLPWIALVSFFLLFKESI